MSKSRKELKENELAGAITDQFDNIKPHLPKILIGIAAIVAVVFGVNALISSRSSAKESKAINLVLFGVENSAAGSLATLDKQIDDFPEDAVTAWAYLMKADRELTSGLEKIFVDKLAGRDFIQRSLKNFDKAIELAGDNKMVKSRARFGLARAFESLGNFEDAAKEFAKLAELGDTPFKTLAEKGIARVNNADNQEFYILFNEKENNALADSLATPADTAPTTNSGLKARPDFTYPGEELDITGSDDDAPKNNDDAPGTNPDAKDDKKQDDRSKKNDNLPPMPSDDVVGKKAEAKPGKSEKKSEPQNKKEDGKVAPKKEGSEKSASPDKKAKSDSGKTDASKSPGQ